MPLSCFAEGKEEFRGEQVNVAEISRIVEQAGHLAGRLVLPKKTAEDEMKEAAGKLNFFYRSEEFQNRVKSETERIKSLSFGESFTRFYPDSVRKEGKGRLADSERVYLFVSSSMPLQTLRNYATSVARMKDPNVIMVMRGFIGGMSRIQPTIDFVSSVLKEDPSCTFFESECRMRQANLVVDPLLFRRYGIDRVPAVVFIKGMKSIDAALSEGDIENTDFTEAYTIYGDASLEYILEKMNRETAAWHLETK